MLSKKFIPLSNYFAKGRNVAAIHIDMHDAQTHKMLFMDLSVAILFLMGILGPLLGDGTAGTVIANVMTGFLVPFMVGASISAVAATGDGGGLRNGSITKILSILGVDQLEVAR